MGWCSIANYSTKHGRRQDQVFCLQLLHDTQASAPRYNCTKSDVCDDIRRCIFECRLNMRLTQSIQHVGAGGLHTRDILATKAEGRHDVRFV